MSGSKGGQWSVVTSFARKKPQANVPCVISWLSATGLSYRLSGSFQIPVDSFSEPLAMVGWQSQPCIATMHYHPPPTRGRTMKFIRRHDLTPYTRIEMVRLAWLNQGIYGKMTQIAQDYHISRTFLYQLMWAANLQLETLFSDQKPHIQAPQPLLEPFILLLRLEGKCSIPSMSSILKYFQYQPNSVGYLSECFQHYGAALPSTLSMAKHTVVFYLSDEIFARHQPILVTIEAQSTAILKMQLASDRAAETWKAHFDDLGDHRFHSLGMASDRGRGLVAGYQAACQDARWVCDRFHEFRDLFDRRRQLERKAYAAIAKEDEAAQTFHNAKSE